MATERLAMDKIREILRLRLDRGLTVREVARGVNVSVGVAQKISSRAANLGLTWADIERLDEAALDERLHGKRAAPGDHRQRPDPVFMHQELRRPGVTLELLHLEYLEQNPNGLRYTAFCDVYRSWRAKAGLVMRQVHRAGEKLFVDFSGNRPQYVDPRTGEVQTVELFVAVLGASNYTYVEAVPTQRVSDLIGAHVRAFEFFGGVPEIVVPDQLKSAVTVACRYEPGIQRTYADMATYYGTAVVPARPYKPRDKAKVEVAVLIVQRWILARIRNEAFFSLEALRDRVRELREDLNARPMKKLGGVSRRELFERYDKPVLRPLPAAPYEIQEWREARVNLDYHLEVDKHFYSVPYALVHQRLWVCVGERTVEVFHRGVRVASHPRSAVEYRHTTCAAHMPEAHRKHAQGLDGVLAWAATVGPMTDAFVRRLLEANPIREQGWRSARGLQRVGEKHGPERTELACRRALLLGARSYKPVERMLAIGTEQQPLPGEEAPASPIIGHENVRGPSYFLN
jgi:transposase